MNALAVHQLRLLIIPGFFYLFILHSLALHKSLILGVNESIE